MFRGLDARRKLLKLVPLDYIFAALCTGFCFSSFITLLTTNATYTDINFVASVNLPLVIITTVIIFAVCVATAFFTKCKKIIPAALLIGAVLFGSALDYKGSYLGEESAKNIFMNIGIGFIMFFIIVWIGKDQI